MGYGLPKLDISFKAAAQAVNNRSKQGVVAVIVREATVALEGLHVLLDPSDIPKNLGTENAAYVAEAFIGSDLGTPSKVILAVMGPVADGNDPLEDALIALSVHTVDYLAAPHDVTAQETAAIATWVKAQRKAYRTVKAVLDMEGADDKGIISPSMTGVEILKEDTGRTSAEMCARMAGLLAGIPSACSSTGAILPEVTYTHPLDDPDEMVDKGKLILIHDGMKAKVGRGVNSLVTIPPEGREDWKKIKIVEGMDLITYFLRTTAEDQWRGRYPNTYDNQCPLLVAIRTFLQELEGTVIQAGSGWADINVAKKKNYLKAQGVEVAGLTDQQIKEYNSGSQTFVAFGCTLIDAIEDFDFVGEL